MAIKKSTLEQKWYYRLAKVFFLLLPFLIAIIFVLRKRVVVCTAPFQENIFDPDPNYIIFLVVALILYFLLLKWLWRGFLYIFFGGLDDDTKKQESNQSSGEIKPKHKKTAQVMPLIIAFIIFAIIALSLMGYIKLPRINPDDTSIDLNNKSGSITCPTTSAQTATPCRSTQGGVGVSGVIVHDSCKCPNDTTYSGTTDYVTPGGPYKICTCN